MLREWAYGRLYGSSTERCQVLPGWLDRYNYHRKHGSLGHRPPVARLNELLGNNLVGNYSLGGLLRCRWREDRPPRPLTAANPSDRRQRHDNRSSGDCDARSSDQGRFGAD